MLSAKLFEKTMLINGAEKKISVYYGDICDDERDFDVLVCSSFKNSYVPAPGSLVSALLYKKDISIEQLSKKPEYDSKQYGAWLSHDTNTNLKRIACIEMLECDTSDNGLLDANTIINGSFYTLYDMFSNIAQKNIPCKNIVMPFIASGYQSEFTDIIIPLMSQTFRMLNDIPQIETITFYEKNANKAQYFAKVLKHYFEQKKEDRPMVFISYSSKQLSAANQICEYLRSKNIVCWMAPNSIAPGLSYEIEIPAAVTDIAVMVLILTPDSEKSNWVQKEIGYAVGNHKSIIPCMLFNYPLSKQFSFLMDGEQIFPLWEYANSEEFLQELEKAVKKFVKKAHSPLHDFTEGPVKEHLSEFVYDPLENARPKDMERITTKESALKFIEKTVKELQTQVGNQKALAILTGGVASTVSAALLEKAIGKQLVCRHINHGLMRKGESEAIVDFFGNQLKLDFTCVDVTEHFLTCLDGVSDPVQKRRIIGIESMRAIENEMRTVKDVTFLAQSTLYPDFLETLKSKSAIKTHHNVGGLPDDLFFELIEPLLSLYPDEVRVVGEALGLPHAMVYRQPLPGPGLGVRCLGAITRDRLHALREADAILREEFDNCGLAEKVWQYFIAVPDFKSVGVKDDKRYEGWPAIIRAVNTTDAMSAAIEEIPYAVLHKITDRITHEVEGINRVLLDLTPKPIGTIEWE